MTPLVSWTKTGQERHLSSTFINFKIWPFLIWPWLEVRLKLLKIASDDQSNVTIAFYGQKGHKTCITLGASKASGVDGITVHLIRSTFPVVAPHLLHIVNDSLVSGVLPAAWKTAIVTLLFKGGDRCEPRHFRPISILSVIGKLCERVVGNQLMSYLTEHHIICAEQHGFRPGHSTESAMLCTVNTLANNMDRGLVSTLTTTDTSKTFNSVQHSRLLDKLGWYGIDDHWFRGWLENRTQCVIGSSTPLPVTHGVVQGSTLGVILFSLCTNDLPSFIRYGQLITYADDAQFIDADTSANIGDLREGVESTLDTALNWFTQNRLKINPSKTDLLVVKSKRTVITENIEIRFGSQNIRPSSSVKVLGIIGTRCLSELGEPDFRDRKTMLLYTGGTCEAGSPVTIRDKKKL